MSQRVVAIGLGVVAAVLLGFGAFDRHWLVNPNHADADGFGLRMFYTCGDDVLPEHLRADDGPQCLGSSNFDYVSGFSGSGVFPVAGWIAFIAALLAAAGLVAAAALALARKQPVLRIAPSSVAILGCIVALIAGCLFIALRPTPTVGLGTAFWAFGAGCVVGFVGAYTLNKVNRPPDPDLTEDAMNPDHF